MPSKSIINADGIVGSCRDEANNLQRSNLALCTDSEIGKMRGTKKNWDVFRKVTHQNLLAFHN